MICIAIWPQFWSIPQLGVLMGAALIFVAYEGFDLIPNAVNEMADPDCDLPRAIMVSILFTISIYILVLWLPLAIAAKPFLGHAGFVLIGIGVLLSTASAINATLFGTARLGKVMAQEKALPQAFSLKERTRDIPWVSLCIISGITLVFVNLGDLAVISSFA
jgi:amino acid transporter